MALDNKLGIRNSAELAHEEERISKTRAVELFDTNYLSSLKPGSFDALSKIHSFLFSDIYDFAEKNTHREYSKRKFQICTAYVS